MLNECSKPRSGTPARASADEATDATARLVWQIASQHEALIQRLEERMHQAIIEHLDKMADGFCNVMMDATSVSIPAGKRLDASSAFPAATGTTAVASSHTSEEDNGDSARNNDGMSYPPAFAEDLGVSGMGQAVDVAQAEMDAAGDAKKEAKALQEVEVSRSITDAEVSRSITTKSHEALQTPKSQVFLKSQVSLATTTSFLDVVQTHGGHCELEIVHAEGLAAADTQCCGQVAMSDPYVKVLLCAQGRRKEVFRTHTRKKTLDPVWNSFCKLKFTPDDSEIVLELWDEDLLSSDDLLGRVRVRLSEIQYPEEEESSSISWTKEFLRYNSRPGTVTRCFDIVPQDDCPNASGKVWLTLSLPSISHSGRLVSRRGHDTLNRLMFLEGGTSESPQRADEGRVSPCYPCPLIGIVARLQDVATSRGFDMVFCTAIIFNAISMLLELEYVGRKSQANLGLDDGSNFSPILESIFKYLNTVFACTFMLELLIRLAAFGCTFLKKPSNWLDVIVVATSVLEVLGTETLVNLTFLRLVRLSKLARLLRILLMATFCNPLRILVKAIYTGFGSLFWSFVLLAIIEIIAGLFMTQILAGHINDENLDLETRRFIYMYYGTTSRTTLTMFEITMAPGAWVSVGRPLVEDVSPAFAWFFVLYVGGVTFAIVRIITALFLRQTMMVATSDDHMMKTEKMKAQRKYTEDIRGLFTKVDTNGTGEISLEQFQTLMRDPHIVSWLDVLELNARNASYVFELSDNGDGRLTLDEFLTGVFRLKGSARQLDMVMLHSDTKRIQHDQKDMKQMLHSFSKQLHDLSVVHQQVPKVAFVPDEKKYMSNSSSCSCRPFKNIQSI